MATKPSEANHTLRGMVCAGIEHMPRLSREFDDLTQGGKLEALLQAQLGLLRGKVTAKPNSGVADVGRSYAQPYDWRLHC